MSAERTLVLIKPDAVRRSLAGEILGRYERKGLRIVAMDLRQPSLELIEKHYGEHIGKPFYPGLRDFVLSGPVVALVLEGDSAISIVRELNGKTDGRQAAPGSIRGDLCLSNQQNLVHGSDSEESAVREINLWFGRLD